MLKCLICGKILGGKKVFEKGKFFCSDSCLKKLKEKAASMKGKPSGKVCEFC